MRTFRVPVTLDVLVTIDETKFDDAFMTKFRKQFYDFDTLQEHVQHVAQLKARGVLSDTFIEGYGPPADMGIMAEADERAESFDVGEPEQVETSLLHVSIVDAIRSRGTPAGRAEKEDTPNV